MTVKAYITNGGHYFPENVVDNSFFESLNIDCDADWIEQRIGIKRRRSVLTADQRRALASGEMTYEQAHKCGESLRSMAKKSFDFMQGRANAKRTPVEKTGLIVCSTSMVDFEIPASACQVAAEIGLSPPSFDINSACSSFVVSVHTLSALLKQRVYRQALGFVVERYTMVADYKDRSSCILFGDSAGCFSIEAREENEPAPANAYEILGSRLWSHTDQYAQVIVPRFKPFWQNGKAVQKFAINETIHSSQILAEECGYKVSDIDYFMGHQANLRMLSSAVEKLGINPEKHFYNVDEFGNQGGAGALTVFSQRFEEIPPGSLVMVAVVGSGLTWGSLLLRKTFS